MKIRLEIADDLKEPEIIIRSTEMNEATAQLVSTLSDYLQKDASIPLYKEATVYYLPLKEILFLKPRVRRFKLTPYPMSFKPSISYMSLKNYCHGILCVSQNRLL